MDRVKPLPQSPKPETPSQDSLKAWHRVVRDPLFLQVMGAYRFSLAERHLAVGCSENEFKEDEMLQIQAEHSFIGKLMVGGLDHIAREVLGVKDDDKVTPIADYMSSDKELPDG